jgi:hypothetical protein
MIPSSTNNQLESDLEPGKWLVGYVFPLVLDAGDDRTGWPHGDEVERNPTRLFFADEQCLDATIGQITDPTGESQCRRSLLGGIPEENPLDAPPYPDV